MSKESNNLNNLESIEKMQESLQDVEDNIIEEDINKEKNNNSNDNLNSFFNDLEESESQDMKVKKDNSLKNTIIISVAAFMVLLALALMYLYLNFDKISSSRTGVNVTITGDSNENSKEIASTESVGDEEESEEVAEEDTSHNTKETKVKLEEWEKVSREKMTDKQKKKMLKAMEEGAVGEMFMGMPSEEEGYTSDPDKMLDKDYVPNPYYVDLTKEDYIEQYSDILMRVINPIYGDWMEYQMENPNKINNREAYAKIFQGVSDGELFSNTEKSKDNPMMFDYDANGFAAIYKNAEKDKNGVRIIGELSSGELIYNEDSTITNNITVKYLLPDGSSFDKDMQLKLKIDSNKKLVLTDIKNKK